MIARLQAWLDPTPSADAPPYDRLLLALILTLATIGVMMVASASMPEGARLAEDPYHFVKRQLFFLTGAGIIAAGVLCLPTQLWQRWSGAVIFIAIGLLALVLVMGTTVNGSTRWIRIPGVGINIQVAEIAKLALFVFMSGYLVRRQQELREKGRGLLRRIGDFIKPILVFAICALLLLAQPDLGSVVVMFVTIMGMMFLAGARLGEFAVLVGLGGGAVAALAYFSPYRWARVTGFLDPWEDPFGKGYQLTQSLMAYGRGDLFGQGLGNSIQKLEYLPEAHTDFIFAVLGEELGFVGVATVMGLLLLLALRALWIGHLALKVEHAFNGYLAYGIGIWFSFQTAVNVGASVGALPTKGLTLPLVSYGGSSLWIMAAATAVLLRIDYERRLVQLEQGETKPARKTRKQAPRGRKAIQQDLPQMNTEPAPNKASQPLPEEAAV